MALHDAYARTTPVELALPDREEAARLVERITEEAESRQVDPRDRQAFVMLGSVGAHLKELKGPEAPPKAIHDYGALLYHAYHCHRSKRPVDLVSVHVARMVVEGAVGEGPPSLPGDAGYVQLPQHLFWTRAGEEDVPESVDGFFWALGSQGLLHLLLAVGMRGDRPGLAVVSVPEAPWSDAGEWLDVRVREDAEDFSTDMPGAELEGLYGLTAAGEALKLAARLFAYLERFPDAVEEPPERDPTAEGGPPEREAASGEPEPSRLPFRRIVLDGSD